MSFDQFLFHNLQYTAAAAALLVVCAYCLPRMAKKGLLTAYILFILYMTLIVRESGSQLVNMELFWSYRQFFTSQFLQTQILQNVLLFIPLGALVCSLKPRLAWLGAAMLFSVLIEAAQYVFHLGLCELDDVVSNGIGAAIGWYILLGIGKLRTYMDAKKRLGGAAG